MPQALGDWRQCFQGHPIPHSTIKTLHTHLHQTKQRWHPDPTPLTGRPLRFPCLCPISQMIGKVSTPKLSTSWRPSTSMLRKKTPSHEGCKQFKMMFWGWTLTSLPNPHWDWHNHPREPEDPLATPQCHHHYHKVWKEFLALPRWASHRYVPATRCGNSCPEH